MRGLALLLLCLSWLALPGFAQDTLAEAEDKSFLERELQELLSGAGREVRITGFEGALSSNARLQRMTISDADGVWLILSDAELIWTRRALFAGRLEIDNLTAQRIEILRAPSSETEPSPSDAAAAPFALPELPVAINIDELSIAEILLAPELLGEPATLTIAGNLTLSDGEGDATLAIDRTDRNDSLSLEGGFSNASRVLRLDVDFSEAADGLVSSLLRIPGTPALGLRIEGEAPLDDYTATIALSSDGQPRFGGQVTVQSDGEEPPGYAVAANLEGDVRPLFVPEFHPFFGEQASLEAALRLPADGRTVLDRLEIASAGLSLSGTLALAADGWPERFAFDGAVGDGTPLRLPSSGGATTVERLTFTTGYDAADGDAWTADVRVDALTTEAFSIATAELDGQGTITRAPAASASGAFSFNLAGLDPGSEDLRLAIGDSPSGRTTFEWTPDSPLRIRELTLQSGDMTLSADADVEALAEGFPISGRVRLLANDISRFSGLAGRELAGVAIAEVEGDVTLLSGAFDVDLDAQTQGLTFSVPRLDPLLRSETALTISALRDETGLRLQRLDLSNTAAQITASGALSGAEGQLDISSRLSDIALIEPKLRGPAEAEAQVAWQDGAPVRLDKLALQLADTTLTGAGALDVEDPKLPATGEIAIRAGDLSRFAALAGRSLAGQVALDLSGGGELQGEAFDLSFDLEGRTLRTGIAQLDRLIAGRLEAVGAAALNGEGLDLSYLRLSSPNLKINASGSGIGGPIATSAQLSDLGLLTDSISGPATLRGALTLKDRLGQRLSVDVNATGPGGLAARVSGQILEYGQSLALSVVGTGPLQLANRFISPRSIAGDSRFNLDLLGPPQLSALSGSLNFEGARVALPRQNMVLNALDGTVALGAGAAGITLKGSAGQGGRFEVAGPIGLTAPYQADLAVRLLQLVLSDGELFDTTLNGDLTIRGPLTGGAAIGGAVNLGQTELRVPSGSGVIIGTLPELRHVAEPSDVHRTRTRAGLTKDANGGGGGGAGFPLDLTVNAPNQIFVRGRGLDAELGGSIRLGGSTNAVTASGVFELIRGRIDILGKRLVMTEGLIDMRGALDPYLRFVAETDAEDVLVRIILEGLASEPTVTFSSVPELPQEEVVSRLLFGRGLDNISAFQAAQLVSAVAQLTGRYDGGLVGNLRSSLGLSDLDVSTTDEGATQVRAGAYLSDNLYSEVTADSDGKQQINLNLDLSESITIKGRADTEGDTGIGIFFERDY